MIRELWIKILCTIYRHPVMDIEDVPDEYTVFVTCACAKRIVRNPESAADWKKRRTTRILDELADEAQEFGFYD